jgi:tetratricopeptide (TPR) repeat protein
MYAYKAAGLCYQFLGRHALAVEAFKDCLDLAVNSTDPSEISNLLGSIGLSFYKQRQYKQAVCSYSQALGVSMSTNLKRQMSKHWGHLGVVYTEMNEYQRAAECFFSAARLCLSMRDLENAIQYYTATMSCYTMCHIPCHGRVLKQIKKATQFKTAMNNVALSNNFAKAYLDQTDILLQSSRNNDAKDMLRYFDGLAKELNLTLTSSQRFETLRQEATAGQG